MEKEIRILELHNCPRREYTVMPIKEAVKILRKKGYKVSRKTWADWSEKAYIINGLVYASNAYIESKNGAPVFYNKETEMFTICTSNELAINKDAFNKGICYFEYITQSLWKIS